LKRRIILEDRLCSLGELKVKTLKISDDAHEKLTSIVGRLMAETGKMKTYSDAIEAMLDRSVILSANLLDEVESFIKKNANSGYTTKEEFIQDAVRFRLACPSVEETSSNLRVHKRKNARGTPKA
jgi:hypothetical protein